MKIHKLILDSSINRVSSFIEFDSRPSLNFTLWYEVENVEVSQYSDAFVTACFLCAMKLGENIFVDGIISTKLLYGLGQLQKYFKYYYPTLKEVTITSKHKKSKYDNKRVGLAFSGGVDSFYSLFCGLPENEPVKEYNITDCVFVQGFDLNEKDFETAKNHYKKLFETLNINLITIKTNIRKIDECVEWMENYGISLISTGLLLENILSKFFVASSNPYFKMGNTIHPSSIQPIVFHSLAGSIYTSTETLDIIHQGLDKKRIEKIKIISNWKDTYDNLRVCWEHPNGIKNCGLCEKCIRTMITLELLGVLNKYTTFSEKLTIENIKKCDFKPKFWFVKDIVEQATLLNRNDIVEALCH